MEKCRYNIKFIICLVITLLWVAVIFQFSLQDAKESGELSGGIVECLKENILRPIVEDEGNMEHVVRKVAHFTEYFVLGMLAVLTVSQVRRLRLRWLWTVLFCFCVAAVDETIQRFVPGRSGQLSDVALDLAGALCGLILAAVVWRRAHSVRNKLM